MRQLASFASLPSSCGVLLVVACVATTPTLTASEAPAAVPAVPVRVTLTSATGAPLGGAGHVVFLRASAEAPIVLPVELPATPPPAHLPSGSRWTVLADFPAYFAAEAFLEVPAGGTSPVELSIALRPAGILTGTYSLQDVKEKPPERLEVRFEPSREGPSRSKDLRSKDLPAGAGPCAIAEGKWRCRVPAGHLDLALHPRGFVPHYLWKVTVAAGETKSLDSLVFRRGASVVGWVTLPDGSTAKACTVRLERAEAPGPPSDPLLEFLRRTALQASCRERGFFQLTGVAPGSYAVIAESGGARALLSPLEVWEGAESRLENPLVLRQPVDFVVELAPATDWMGRPWQVKAQRASDYRAGWEEPPVQGKASPENGRMLLAKQAPGRFWITVYDWAGNAMFSDSHVDLLDPVQPYPILLDLLWVEGSVRLGDEPLQGTLFFGGRNGATSIKMESDRDGRFEGPLPRDGRWHVGVESDEPYLRTSAQTEVERDGSRASATIELPGTHVYGRVVDSAGNPAPRAQVDLGSTLGTIATESDEEGEFELRAFPEGASEISAARSAGDGGRETSDTLVFEASEDAAHGPVVLVLQRNRSVRGRVLAATGPVVGATVSAWPDTGGDGTISTLRTRLDGSFELKLPERSGAMQVIVRAPGGKLKAYNVALAGAEEVVLQVETHGGEVLIDVGSREAFDDELLAVWQGEIAMPTGILVRWAQGHGVRYLEGSRVRLPEVASGFYTACAGSPAVVEIETWKQRARCSSGYLAAGSALELRLPSSAPSR